MTKDVAMHFQDHAYSSAIQKITEQKKWFGISIKYYPKETEWKD